ncbi:putative neutral sphingomyelinase isoform X2 [Daktulosphaira vitifoliae]|uniref:putative neutral sphingomyelinase isoform X2 n=1 Tax=Daktulosphaira vitifoliae TaxID=58002 RepID=UPI0021AA7326|nr:putative neutral sphingomyelinase isoform X2 [Daktulosphaira vitifoliae]
MYLSVFTLNVWGLKYFGKNRSIRIRKLAKVLIDNKYDIVCLQELWCEDDFEHLKNTCKERFKHSHYFNSGMLGSGMCIMSHYPIIDIHYHSFLLNGYLHMLFHGDWFGGKGIGLCCININGLIVNVYTTHLHACYNPSHDKYEKHRILQAFETANFIRLTSVGSDLSILAGDLNSEPNNICCKLIEKGSNMKDCYSMCVTNKIEWTFNHPRNSYKNTKEPTYRIDYIMYKSNENNITMPCHSFYVLGKLSAVVYRCLLHWEHSAFSPL